MTSVCIKITSLNYPITYNYSNSGANSRTEISSKFKKCWFCESICKDFVAICGYCKYEKFKKKL